MITTSRTSVPAIMVILIVSSLSSAMILANQQKAYAHVFTGDESASFMSVIKTLQAEANLVQSLYPSNFSLAMDHAQAIVDVVNGNHTFGILRDEVSENNKRVAADVINSADALRAALHSYIPPADVKAKVENLNATLQEANAVRLPKDAASNSTINGLATKDLVNETLRQYSYAFGVANASGASKNTTAKSGDPSSSSTITNMSAYQSAKALFSQAETMLSQAKSVIPANATATTKATIVKLATELSQLKSSIDAKDPYEKVATLVMKTIYPDLDAAFRLK